MLNKTVLKLFIALAAAIGASGCTQRAAEKTIGADVSALGNKLSEDAKKGADADTQATAAVTRALVPSPKIQTSELKVTTKNRHVTITGFVTTEAQRQRGEQIAKSVLGKGFTIDNQLKVGSGSY